MLGTPKKRHTHIPSHQLTWNLTVPLTGKWSSTTPPHVRFHVTWWEGIHGLLAIQWALKRALFCSAHFLGASHAIVSPASFWPGKVTVKRVSGPCIPASLRATERNLASVSQKVKGRWISPKVAVYRKSPLWDVQEKGN